MVNPLNNGAQQAFLSPFQQQQTGNNGQLRGQEQPQQQSENQSQQAVQSGNNTAGPEQALQTQSAQAVQPAAETGTDLQTSSTKESGGTPENFQDAERGSLLDITV